MQSLSTSRRKRDKSVQGSQAIDSTFYASSAYWTERYSTAAGFHNWYYTFGDLQPLIHRALERTGETLSTCHALEIGCGDSPLLTDFCSAKGGQSRSESRRLHGIDIAGNVIEHLKSRQAKHTLSELKFSCMDATRLEFSEKCFDLVIDKGTVDALMCEKDETKMAQVMRRLIGETLRVMKANGAILLVSHMQPDSELFSQFISSCMVPALEAHSMSHSRSWSVESHAGNSVAGRAAVHIISSKERRTSPRLSSRASRTSALTISLSVLEYSDSDDD